MLAKTALVTGASRGIGLCIANEFARQGYSVVLSARSREKLEECAAKLPVVQEGQSHSVWPRDLSDTRVDLTVDFPVDVLINNAGVARTQLLARQPRVDMEEMLRVNMLAPFLLTKSVVREMLKRRAAGSIVFIGSAVASRGVSGGSVYAATKGALESFSATLARELGPKGIRVNVVAPGLADTAMVNGARNLASMNAINTNEFVDQAWIAKTVLQIAENPNVTGCTYRIDNGFAA